MVNGLSFSGLRAAALTVPSLAMTGCLPQVGEIVSQSPGAAIGGMAALTAITGGVGVAAPRILWRMANKQVLHAEKTGQEPSRFLVKAAEIMVMGAGERIFNTGFLSSATNLCARLAGIKSLDQPHHAKFIPSRNLEWRSFSGVRVCREVAKEILKRKGSLEGAILVGDFSGFDFSHAKLHRADFREAVLQGANFSGAYLGGAKLTGLDLEGVCFISANLHRADLIGAKLGGADLTLANLAGAFLKDAQLNGAILECATLDHASCFNVDFTDADLRNARFEKAWLMGATFSDGVDLKGSQFEKAYFTSEDVESTDDSGYDPESSQTWPYPGSR
ncbi:MAG: pentapeptide repeat-containing protein [bacterium]|nr:pentapeptide repeat-containing protein [bacterium]MBU1919157.1 pentapeptide repeat-containing protein [bacterium]